MRTSSTGRTSPRCLRTSTTRWAFQIPKTCAEVHGTAAGEGRVCVSLCVSVPPRVRARPLCRERPACICLTLGAPLLARPLAPPLSSARAPARSLSRPGSRRSTRRRRACSNQPMLKTTSEKQPTTRSLRVLRLVRCVCVCMCVCVCVCVCVLCVHFDRSVQAS